MLQLPMIESLRIVSNYIVNVDDKFNYINANTTTTTTIATVLTTTIIITITITQQQYKNNHYQ